MDQDGELIDFANVMDIEEFREYFESAMDLGRLEEIRGKIESANDLEKMRPIFERMSPVFLPGYKSLD